MSRAVSDPELAALIREEEVCESTLVQMIASENLAPAAVRAPLSTCLSNKYCEGAPGERTYPGVSSLDRIESLALQRCLRAFGLAAEDWYANLQVLSGAPANLCVCGAILACGETLLAMHHDHGGHMSHGTPDSLISKFFHVENYLLGPDCKVDVAAIEARVLELRAADGGRRAPRMLIAGYSVCPSEVPYDELRALCDKYSMHLHADISHVGGIVAADCVLRQRLPEHEPVRRRVREQLGRETILRCNPFDWADTVVSTTHKSMRGPRGAILWARRRTVDCARLAEAVFPGLQAGPHMATVASVAALMREVVTPEYCAYQLDVLGNARALADELTALGVPVMTGTTETHMVVAYAGPQRGDALNALLGECGVIANSAPFPHRDALHAPPSGVRLGAPFMTSRGLGAEGFREIARTVAALARHLESPRAPEETAAVVAFHRQNMLDLVGTCPALDLSA